MNTEAAIAQLAYAARFNLPALLAWAAVTANRSPEDAAAVRVIMAALIA